MVLNLSIHVDSSTEEKLKLGARQIISHVKPEWLPDNLHFKSYSGITNKLIGVWNDDKADQVLIRVYGDKTELFIDRAQEKYNLELIHKHGCGPELYCSFINGLCYGFVLGSPLDTDNVIQTDVWKSITHAMANMHKIKSGESENAPSLFPLMRKFLNLLPATHPSASQRKRLEDKGYTKQYLNGEIDALEVMINELNCPVVFCHNDILLGNIIWDGDKVHFIDYEYAAPNYQPYDIANHFNEMAGIDTVDYNLFPSEEFQKKWLWSYLEAYNGDTAKLTDREVEVWRVWVNKFTLASHLSWGVWSIVQAVNSTIDFDFLEYSFIRLDEYRRRKEEVLAISIPK